MEQEHLDCGPAKRPSASPGGSSIRSAPKKAKKAKPKKKVETAANRGKFASGSRRAPQRESEVCSLL